MMIRQQLEQNWEKQGVNRFFGIPYAEPPAGDLSMKPKTTLDSAFDATRFGKFCIQMVMLPLPVDENVTI